MVDQTANLEDINTILTELKKKMEELPKQGLHQSCCPSCGYCPCCGRGGHYYQPYYQWPSIPTIWCGTTQLEDNQHMPLEITYTNGESK